MPEKKQTVHIDGHAVNLSNLDKTLFPESKIIKAEIIQYHLAIAPYLMHFGQNRPLTLIRYPDGIQAHSFYSKNAPDWRPDWIQTKRLEDDDNNYMLLQGRQDLIWLANLAALEIHAMNKLWISDRLMMDHIVFDLDPPDTFDYTDLRDLTISIGNYLEISGLPAFVKTSGSRGAHIYISIAPTENYQAVIDIIKQLALDIQHAFPDRTTNHFRKDKRDGKILLDINRNFAAQTTVLPFSTRAREHAPVSMPLTWEDFGKTRSSQDFTIENCIPFLTKNDNAWRDFTANAIDIAEWNRKRLLGPEPPINNTRQKESPQKSEAHEKAEYIPSEPEWYAVPAYKHMLAGVTESLISDASYIYENKWDGIRVFVYIFHNSCKIFSRSGREITGLFPDIHPTTNSHQIETVLDGELVVTDSQGRPDFPRVISRMHSKSSIEHQIARNPATFYVFDILRLGDQDLCNLPWQERREELSLLLTKIPSYKLSQGISEGQLLYDAAQAMDLEGIMIKKIHATYEQGKRTDTWLKLKFRDSMTCVILGYTKGEGKRNGYFGSLHIAEIVEDQLNYRGRVGTGFDDAKIASLQQLFDAIPKGEKWINAETEDNSKTIWFDNHFPYCEIQYARQTENKTLREPVFKKLIERFYDRT